MSSQPPISAELWDQIPPAAKVAILALVQQYERRLQNLQTQVTEHQQRLNQNSTNFSVDGVEPTNNAAERAVRHGVLWRKMSHGPKSVAGSEYLSCIWSVVETCRQQGQGVWDFLTVCMASAAQGRSLPSLLTLPNSAQAA